MIGTRGRIRALHEQSFELRMSADCITRASAEVGAAGEIRTLINMALNHARLPELRHDSMNLVPTEGFEPTLSSS
jgi:hypothetical protein